MPSLLHEIPLLLIEDEPSLLLHLLSHSLKLEIPAFTKLTVGPADHNEVLVIGGQSDRVLILSRPDPTEEEPGRTKPVLGIINESQLDPDEEKWLSWPHYHSSLRRKLGCTVWLVVICPRAATAKWAARPVPMYQPESRFVPLVLGPAEIPRVSSLEEARLRPALAVLSAVVHSGEPDSIEVTRAGLYAADLIAERGGRKYDDLILDLLDDASIQLLEKMLMQNEDRLFESFGHGYLGTKLKAKSEAKGRAEGQAKALLMILSERALPISEEQRQRIQSCQDIPTLDIWFKRSLRATSVDEILA